MYHTRRMIDNDCVFAFVILLVGQMFRFEIAKKNSKMANENVYIKKTKIRWLNLTCAILQEEVKHD